MLEENFTYIKKVMTSKAPDCSSEEIKQDSGSYL